MHHLRSSALAKSFLLIWIMSLGLATVGCSPSSPNETDFLRTPTPPRPGDIPGEKQGDRRERWRKIAQEEAAKNKATSKKAATARKR